MLAQRCLGWHLTTMGKSHLNSRTDMSNAFSCTTRETMEEANEHMFKGDPRMAQGTWTARGDVGGATDIFMVLRQDLQTTEAEPPDSTAHDAGGIFRRNERNESGRPMERLRRRSLHQRRAA